MNFGFGVSLNAGEESALLGSISFPDRTCVINWPCRHRPGGKGVSQSRALRGPLLLWGWARAGAVDVWEGGAGPPYKQGLVLRTAATLVPGGDGRARRGGPEAPILTQARSLCLSLQATGR